LVRWRWAAAGAMATACTVTVVLLLIGSASVAPPAALALDRAAAAVAQRAGQPPLRPGQYWYTRMIYSGRSPLPIFPRIMPSGHTLGNPPLVWFLTRESAETWIGLDGTLRERHIELARRFASAADRAGWLAARQPPPKIGASDSITAGDGWFPPQLSGALGDPGDGLFSYRQLLSLPTEVSALRARIERALAAFQARRQRAFSQAAKGTGYAAMQYTAGQGVSATDLQAESDLQAIALLLASPIPTGVRASLYRVAATLPGVRYAGRMHDPLGRSGVAVAVGHGPHETRMIFDPHAGALLAYVFGGYVTTATVAQGVVGSISGLPRGVASIPGPPGLEPEVLAIYPRVGGSRTAFTLERSSRGSKAPRDVARAFDALLFGPTGPGCRSSLAGSPFVTLPRGTVTARHGRVTHIYRLSPSVVGASAWCAGRYQLQTLASGASNSQSQSAIYFEVS
jgi:hypothetical protein